MTTISRTSKIVETVLKEAIMRSYKYIKFYLDDDDDIEKIKKSLKSSGIVFEEHNGDFKIKADQKPETTYGKHGLTVDLHNINTMLTDVLGVGYGVSAHGVN